MNPTLRSPTWWPRLVWRHHAGEVFGFSPVRRLLGISFGVDIFIGLVITERAPDIYE